MTNKDDLSPMAIQLPESYESLLENGIYPADEGREQRIVNSLSSVSDRVGMGELIRRLAIQSARAVLVTAALATAGPQVLRFVFGIWFATTAH